MKRRDENHLIKLAFGEAELSSADEPLDRESALKLDLYRQMRQDLLDARDAVPPDQLSPERLRESILRSGLKKERRTLWTWALAPSLALLVALIALNREHPEANVVASSFEAADEAFQAVAPPVVETAPRQAETNVAPPAAAPKVAPKPTPNRSKHVRPSPKVLLASRADQPSPPAVAMADVMETSRSGMDSTALDAPETASPPTVVLIESTADQATGMNIATEVRPAANVVIGS